MNTNTSTATPTRTPKQMFGDGRYSNMMKELYHDAQEILIIPAAQAERLARSFAADFARANAQVAGKVGKLGKNGQVTLKEAATAKNITLTYALSLGKLVSMLKEAKAFGVDSYSGIELNPDHQEWLEKSDGNDADVDDLIRRG